MSVSLLTDLATGTLDVNGSVTVVNTPSVGDYWAPLIVGVSTGSALTPVAHATVYRGSPGVAPNQTQYIDDTFNANGDTSSVISGTTLQYGEAIITTFVGGTPGDIATVIVYGQTSDIPPNLSLAPQVPGTRFSGHPTTEVIVRNAMVLPGVPVVLAPLTGRFINGAQIDINGYTDVRQYGAYSLQVMATAQGGVATNVESCDIIINWSADPTGSNVLYQDIVSFWTDGNNATFNTSNGNTYMQDVHHGPYIRVNVMNRSTADNVEINYTLVFTTRLPQSHHVMQSASIQGTLANEIGALGVGATRNILCPIMYGRASWRIENTGAGAGLIYNIYYGRNTIIRQFILAPGASDERDVILPKNALRFEIVAPAATSYKVVCTSLFDKMG